MPDQGAITEAIDHIVRLRRAEAGSDPTLRPEIAAAREFIERSIGPTVRPAAAARLLGVSQTALSRWLKKGDIASVLTPGGRREIPLEELIDLLGETERLGVTGTSRPLTAVIRARRRNAEDAIDLNRLLPRKPRAHRAAELHALAYHRLVAERLDDRLAEHARRRLERWRTTGRIHPHWSEEWQRILALPLPQMKKAISVDTPRARELRQTSPFAGALSEHERRLLHEAVERRVSV
jgi:hypothetical protein